MNPTIKTILAGVAGVITSFIAVFLVEALGHLAYPPPDNLNMNDTVGMAAYVQSLPIGALLFVLVGWFVGIVAGGVLVRIMMPQRSVWLTSFVGIMMWVASGINMSMIPHPIWFALTAHMGIPVVAIATGMLLRMKK